MIHDQNSWGSPENPSRVLRFSPQKKEDRSLPPSRVMDMVLFEFRFNNVVDNTRNLPWHFR
jgi:hypothetical protein